MKKVAVSGANGFLGSALLARLRSDGYPVHALVRRPASVAATLAAADITSLQDETSWQSALQQCCCLIHCAGRAHVSRRDGRHTLSEFHEVNTALTLHLARQAVEAGVSRFIFISSIGVNGGESGDKPFTPADTARPHTPYACSKLEAEQGLAEIARQTGLEVVVVRPPLIYGRNAPGNFGALLRGIEKGWPLPFGLVTENRRSLVALDNLVDLLVTCVNHPAASNQTFLVSDGEDVSTAELLRRIALALGKPARLLPVPPALMRAGAAAIGRNDLAQSLLSSLQIDLSKTRDLLGWAPPVSMDEGLRRSVQDIGAAGG